MATYTILTDRAVAAVADAYGLKIIRWQPMAGGYENSIFMLSTDQGDFVLTFYEKKSTSDGKLNARLSNHPADHNCHTNQVVPDENGKLVSQYQTRTLVIKAWIPGDMLRDVPQTDYSSIGRALALLHKIPAPDFLSNEHPYGLKEYTGRSQACDRSGI